MNRVVEETDLEFRNFQCCGDEDLYPFGCPECGRLMVFCYECDTLYEDLNNLPAAGRGDVNHFNADAPIFSCPECSYRFEYFFVRDGKYKVTYEQWKESDAGHLLKSGTADA